MHGSPVQGKPCGELRGHLTHLSIDGLTTPLGQSQVLAVSQRLQSMGWSCTVLSLEPECSDQTDLESLEHRVASSGVCWQRHVYRPGRVGTMKNVASMAAMVREAQHDTDLFHCRSYVGAFFPAFARVFRGVPYVFDTRGYWVDEKIESGRWFQDPATLAVARKVERYLYQQADGVVSLTEIAAEDVRHGRFGRRHSSERSICIPTCVDYERFNMEKRQLPNDFLQAGPIVAYVGALNPSYEFRKSLQLVARILEQAPRAKFLALTSQVSEMISLADEFSIPVERRLVTRVAHDDMHLWLPWIDFGLLLLIEPNRAKRASMPTKLGEFLAAGVSPICHGANDEVEGWVRRAGSGIVLSDLSTESLNQAVEFVARGTPPPEELARARRVAEPHFSLEAAVHRYDQLFQDILTSRAAGATIR